MTLLAQKPSTISKNYKQTKTVIIIYHCFRNGFSISSDKQLILHPLPVVQMTYMSILSFSGLFVVVFGGAKVG